MALFTQLERYKSFGQNIYNVKMGLLTAELSLITLRNWIDYYVLNGHLEQTQHDKLVELISANEADIEAIHQEIVNAN